MPGRIGPVKLWHLRAAASWHSSLPVCPAFSRNSSRPSLDNAPRPMHWTCPHCELNEPQDCEGLSPQTSIPRLALPSRKQLALAHSAVGITQSPSCSPQPDASCTSAHAYESSGTNLSCSGAAITLGPFLRAVHRFLLPLREPRAHAPCHRATACIVRRAEELGEWRRGFPDGQGSFRSLCCGQLAARVRPSGRPSVPGGFQIHRFPFPAACPLGDGVVEPCPPTARSMSEDAWSRTLHDSVTTAFLYNFA